MNKALNDSEDTKDNSCRDWLKKALSVEEKDYLYTLYHLNSKQESFDAKSLLRLLKNTKSKKEKVLISELIILHYPKLCTPEICENVKSSCDNKIKKIGLFLSKKEKISPKKNL
jgi:hypothetical protein